MIYFCTIKHMTQNTLICNERNYVSGLSSVLRLHVGMSIFELKRHPTKACFADISLLSQLKRLYLSNLDHNIFIID